MTDVVNIHLAVPKPIVFTFHDASGGEVTLTISGRISFGTALTLRRLDSELASREAEMYAALAVAQTIDSDTATMKQVEDISKQVESSMLAFEDAANALSEAIRLQFIEQPDAVPFGHEDLRQIASVIWSRAFGATDEELARLSTEAEEGNDPPTRGATSTSRNGSTASAKRTAARPTNGSRRR